MVGGAGNWCTDRMNLAELTQSAQADIDRIAAEHPNWAAGPPVSPNPNPPAAYREWRGRLDAARHQLDGLATVQAELQSNDGTPRLLGLLDDQGRAAVSIGNPDTASHSATFVPGTGQDLVRMPYSTEDAEAMFQAALRANQDLAPEDLSVTTWMGYDRPMDLFDAASPDFARGGGADLAAFQEGMRVTHEGGQSVNTVIGHSYGSTLVGAAASGGNELEVDNVIAVGSPGMLVDQAADLGLGAGADVYATRARFDPINLATGFTLGSSPTTDGFGAIQLQAAAGPNTGPPILDLPSIAAHSSYWDQGNPALRNMGAIIGGMPPPHIVPPGG
ncbi:alpha/beta hydrolase [Mycolicibacterium duvalii]|nr:alpha/beta hydrolase [Mycolicibacterium duvalii]